MTQRKYARKPLMYIAQPNESVPKARMQHEYRSERTIEASHSEQSQRRQKITSLQKNKEALLEVDETERDREEEGSDQNQNEDKKFVDMNIEEKIHYFLSRTVHMPKLKCEIITEEQTYRGIITDYQDEKVTIQSTRRPMRFEIALAEIQEINLLGF